jgi:predicted glycoside hydrolase/deacetylase ChbG (UPF0249 family)
MNAPAPGVGTRRLIVNADDFGQSPGINDGIIRCHEQGIVTSASLMVLWPWAATAAEYARKRSALSVGLHIDLCEWVYHDGEWRPLYQIVPLDDAEAVETEIVRQVELFRQLVQRDPTHIDSHQDVHQHEPVDALVARLSDRLGVPCRALGDVSYRGEFYGQTGYGLALDDVISVERLTAILTTLPEGTTELGCHPGLRGDALGMYVDEREREVQVLCDPGVRAAIDAEGIELISYHDLLVYNL